MPMTSQNGAHACDCGKVKVTLLDKRNAAEAITAPLNGKVIAIDTEHRCSQRAAPVKRCCPFYLQNISYLLWERIAQNDCRVKLEEVYHFIPNIAQSVFTCY